MSTILKVNALSKWFGKIKAIEDLSFEVKKGQVLGLLGPNGSGKTTTLAIVMGIKHPTSGSYHWFDGAHLPRANKRIGSVIEVPYFFPDLSLEKNLELVARVRENGVDEISHVLDMVGLIKRRKSQKNTARSRKS